MKNIYLFSLKENESIKKEFEIVNEFIVNFDSIQWNRIMCISSNDAFKDFENKNVYVYVALDKFEHNDCLIEYDDFNNDCNKVLYNLIKRNNLLGFSSKFHNRIIDSLLCCEDNSDKKKYSIKGENGWNNLEEFFSTLNESSCPYVVLRKYETLPKKLDENDKDIDFLCSDKFSFMKIANAKRRSFGVSGYYIIVNNEKISIDIRYKGDRYLDSSWEENILSNKKMLNNIYVMNSENQIYSILYHVLTQKNHISSYYIKMIENFFDKSDVNNLINYLILYMKKNSYSFKRPIDRSVYQNKKNIRVINKNLRQNIFLLNVLRMIPDYLMPKKLKMFFLNNIE